MVNSMTFKPSFKPMQLINFMWCNAETEPSTCQVHVNQIYEEQ